MKEILDFSTSVIRRNLKLIHVWTNFSFLHMFHVQNFEIFYGNGLIVGGFNGFCGKILIVVISKNCGRLSSLLWVVLNAISALSAGVG